MKFKKILSIKDFDVPTTLVGKYIWGKKSGTTKPLTDWPVW